MSTAPTVPALSGSATVRLSVDRAFEFFTGSFGAWWPAEYHIGQAAMADAVLEPREGGRWYETGVDGTECDWGRVRVWDPPNRLVLTWQINGQWRFDDDPQHASEIEIRFVADGPEQTIVQLHHRHLDRLVADQAIHDTIEHGGGGWSTVLERFAKAAEAAA